MSTEQEYPPLEFPGWERKFLDSKELYFCRTIGGRRYSYRVGAPGRDKLCPACYDAIERRKFRQGTLADGW